jgi:hypothetical protein
MTDVTTVRIEVWPISADSVGLWLISGNDAWRSGAITQDSDPHAAAEELLRHGDALADVKLLHSTSWRAEDSSIVLSYVAVVGCSEFARSKWPDAEPIDVAVLAAVGKPFPVAADQAPLPRYIDVLLHGLRHLKFLLRTDSSARAALCEMWRDHLAVFTPALAGMYEHGLEPLTIPDTELSN